MRHGRTSWQSRAGTIWCVIEDCAHAIETAFHGQNAGTFGDFGCFSFYATKNVATGEGGMFLVAATSRMARGEVLGAARHEQGRLARASATNGYKHYQVVECGFKYNMMDLQAAIGLHQLAAVELHWQRRRQLWEFYDRAFADLPVTLPAALASDSRHGYHLYTMMIDPKRCGLTRDSFLDAMNCERIGTGVHYLSVPEHPYYQQQLGWNPSQWPHARRLGRQTVSLPLSPALSDTDADRVVDAVRKILSL